MQLNPDKRFQDAKFAARQTESLTRRRALLLILGLLPGQEEWFEMPEKKSATVYNAAELRNITGLTVVSPIFREGMLTPAEVTENAHGTVIYQNQMILRQSTPYREEIVADKLEVDEDGFLTFDIPSAPQALPENCTFRNYDEGTILDIMLVNGELHYLTLRNLIPKGVKAPTTADGKLCNPNLSEWLHQPGRWGANNTTPFYNSFAKIVSKVDSNWMNPTILYPPGCKFSPVKYRFIITTRDKVRASAQPVGPLGYLVYLGHSYEWAESDWLNAGYTTEQMGTWHAEKDIYKPAKYPTVPPADVNAPYILSQSPDIGLKAANAILSGNYAELIRAGKLSTEDALRFSGGGKLIVNINYTMGNRPFSTTVHIASSAWMFRERIMGNDSNLYNHFQHLMSIKGLNPKDPNFATYFTDKFSILETPMESKTLVKIYDSIKLQHSLPAFKVPETVSEFGRLYDSLDVHQSNKLIQKDLKEFYLIAEQVLRKIWPDTRTSELNQEELPIENDYYEEELPRLKALYNSIRRTISGLPLVTKDSEYLLTLSRQEAIPRCIWYNFLCCANPSIREKVYRFFVRYVWELQKASTWLVRTNLKTIAWKQGTKDEQKVRDLISLARRKAAYKEYPLEIMYSTLQNSGNKGADVISLVIKYAGLQKESILKSEPNAAFLKPKSYSEACTLPVPVETITSRPVKVGRSAKRIGAY